MIALILSQEGPTGESDGLTNLTGESRDSAESGTSGTGSSCAKTTGSRSRAIAAVNLAI